MPEFSEQQSWILLYGRVEGLDEGEQIKAVVESDGFAEIYPEDKYKIVKLLQ